jgi:hypothetical protein
MTELANSEPNLGHHWLSVRNGIGDKDGYHSQYRCHGAIGGELR